MPATLFILSCPVQLPDGGYGVMVGTGRGTRTRRFSARRWARCYHALLLVMARAVVEAPIDLVVIDDVTDFPALQSRVACEYAQRGLAAAFRPVDDCRLAVVGGA
jgi:hypothetical protein